jgi:hypothetical protein
MGLDGRKASAMENEKVEGEEEVVETGKGKKSVEELRLAGNEAFKGGEMERAGQLWAAALATDPTNVAVLSNRAMLHLKIKDFHGVNFTPTMSSPPLLSIYCYRRIMMYNTFGEMSTPFCLCACV